MCVLSAVGGRVTVLWLLEPSFSVLFEATVSPYTRPSLSIPSHLCRYQPDVCTEDTVAFCAELRSSWSVRVLVCRCAGRQSRCHPQACWDWSRCFDGGQINRKPKSKSKHLCKCTSATNSLALHWWGQRKHTLLRDKSSGCHPWVLTLTLVYPASTPLSLGDSGDIPFTVKLVMGWQNIAYVSVMLLVVRLCVGGTGTGTKVQTIIPTWFGFSRSVL